MRDGIELLIAIWIALGMAVLSLFVFGLPVWIFLYILARMAG